MNRPSLFAVMLGVTCASVAVVALLASPAAAASSGEADASLLRRIWLFLGVFHPMVVHFPIALLTLAALAELGRAAGLINLSRDVTWICLLVGALTAIVAAGLGWANASEMSQTSTLTTHRWLGVSVTLLAVALAAVTTWQRYRPQVRPGRLYLLAMAVLAGAVGFTGHHGGMLVYGDTFIQRAWRDAFDRPDPAPPTQTAVAVSLPDLDDPDARVDFAEHVWPILEARCIECHGPEKSDGRLRLHEEQAAREGGRSGDPITPGEPENSLMIEMITSPFDDERMPPPEEDDAVTDDELEILKRWIDQGAEWTTP